MPLTRPILAVAVLLASLAPAPAQSRRDVKLEEYKSEDGRYRVRLPAKHKSETKDLAIGPGQSVLLATERGDGPGGSVYAVTYSDYPESFKEVSAKTILDGVRDGLKGTDGKVIKDDELLLGADKVPGRELRIEAGNRVIRARVFLAGTRLYQVMVTGTRDSAGAKSAGEFLESFEIAK